MTSIQPELWVDRGAEAAAFYQAAFGATVLHRVGDGQDIAAQLAIGDAAFWVSTAGSAGQRIHPKAPGGATSRTLLIVDDPRGGLPPRDHRGRHPISPPGRRTRLPACPGHRPIRPAMGNRAPPRHLAATPTLITTGNRLCQRRQPFPAHADHPVQRPHTRRPRRLDPDRPRTESIG